MWNLKLWDATNGKLVRELVGHEKSITDIAFSPDGDFLATASFDQTVRLWDPKNGRELRKLMGPGQAGSARRHPERNVIDLCVSPDGLLLATATFNRAVNGRPDRAGTDEAKAAPAPQPAVAIKIWRVADGRLLHVLPGHTTAAFSSDSQRIAGVDDRSVKTWDVATGKELRTFSGPTDTILKVARPPSGTQTPATSSPP